MIVSQNMVAEAEIICQQSQLDVKYRRVQIDVGSPPSSSPSFGEVCVSETVSAEVKRFESVVRCSETIANAVMETPAVKFVPKIHSGSHIFDGHGGPQAATYIKRNAMRLFFEDADFPRTVDFDGAFFKELENSHKKAFLLADQALADEHSVDASCGTTALTALVLGRQLLVANAGDCRAVLCRKGVAFDMSQDHKPTYSPERRRVEQLGGYIDDGYLNGYLSVTRTLGNWDFKLPLGSSSPLIAEPDVQQIMLTEDDEFLILSCDGIWDVMSSQYAVSLVRRELRKHNDPEQCARELVKEALRLYASDNLTVIVVCLSSPDRPVESRSEGPRLRNCSFSKLRSLLEGN
ncbi:hypothetical protein ACLB2K_037187 [Fragaria x ananassa]